jgi:hypothetical protein
MSDNVQNLQPPGSNPLQKHFRQPKIYIKLPSDGKWWPEGSLELPENGEIPVYPMTAKDEITMRTPDALLNGQSTVDVIQSCIPNIKDAWKMPSIDLDVCLIAIRIASFGEKMEINTKIPNTTEERAFDLDLRHYLDMYISQEFEDVLQAGDFLVQIKPMSYQTFTQIALKTFEEQRLIAIVTQDDKSDSEKMQLFNKSFKTLTEINLNTVFDSVTAIQYQQDDPVTNRQHIREFLENTDTVIYNAIRDHVEMLRDRFQLKPLDVETTPEERELGAPETFKLPLSFDHSSFFGRKS